jgi:hypothetical protein
MGCRGGGGLGAPPVALERYVTNIGDFMQEHNIKGDSSTWT